eukprot:jgi/Bigna1/62818/fgenesh1_kg.42_\
MNSINKIRFPISVRRGISYPKRLQAAASFVFISTTAFSLAMNASKRLGSRHGPHSVRNFR